MAHLEDPAAWPDLERQVLGSGRTGWPRWVPASWCSSTTPIRTCSPASPREPTRLDDDGLETVDRDDAPRRRPGASRFGLQLAYHPHAETHVEYEDQIEAFLEQTDPRAGVALPRYGTSRLPRRRSRRASSAATTPASPTCT